MVFWYQWLSPGQGSGKDAASSQSGPQLKILYQYLPDVTEKEPRENLNLYSRPLVSKPEPSECQTVFSNEDLGVAKRLKHSLYVRVIMSLIPVRVH